MDYIAITPDVFELLTTTPQVDCHIPHYDNKALVLYSLLAYRAGADLKFHTNKAAMCHIMGLVNRTENQRAIMNNLLKMQEDGIIEIKNIDQSFFWIALNKDVFMPQDNYAIIHFKEFEYIFTQQNRDTLLMLLYHIKRHTHQNTRISFISERTLAGLTYLNRETVQNGLKKLRQNVFNTYKVQIKFNEGYPKTICYYKSLCDGSIDTNEIENIAHQYYDNIKSITRKDNTK